MNTNNNDKTGFLASSDDWESWNLQFQAQAAAGGIWNEVQGVTPFLDKPTAPNPVYHKHKDPSQSTIAARGSTASNSTASSSTASNSTESVAGDGEPGPANQQLNLPITTADLTADGLRTYQMDWMIYQANQKEYAQQVEKTAELKQWILKTTSSHH